MNNVAVQQRHLPIWPDISEFLAGFPAWSSLRPNLVGHPIKVEDEIKDGRYELRAELPGVDPDKDVDITIRNGILTIKAERSEKKESSGRSEFAYGSFTRSVTLPGGADEEGIKATYDNGILNVSVPVNQAEAPGKRVTIETAN